MNGIIQRFSQNQFLFEELVKRDFKQKYKSTILGMAWSVLSPLLNLLVMRIIFTHFFGEEIEHYTTYLFAGNLIFSFFRESTTGGMNSLMSNAHIFTKINVPKYMFLLTKNVSSIINFGLTLLVFFVFAAIDGVQFTWKFLTLLYPICCLTIFNIGIGAVCVFPRHFVFVRRVHQAPDVYVGDFLYRGRLSCGDSAPFPVQPGVLRH